MLLCKDHIVGSFYFCFFRILADLYKCCIVQCFFCDTRAVFCDTVNVVKDTGIINCHCRVTYFILYSGQMCLADFLRNDCSCCSCSFLCQRYYCKILLQIFTNLRFPYFFQLFQRERCICRACRRQFDHRKGDMFRLIFFV